MSKHKRPPKPLDEKIATGEKRYIDNKVTRISVCEDCTEAVNPRTGEFCDKTYPGCGGRRGSLKHLSSPNSPRADFTGNGSRRKKRSEM
jgi:hypothetical protein